MQIKFICLYLFYGMIKIKPQNFQRRLFSYCTFSSISCAAYKPILLYSHKRVNTSWPTCIQVHTRMSPQGISPISPTGWSKQRTSTHSSRFWALFPVFLSFFIHKHTAFIHCNIIPPLFLRGISLNMFLIWLFLTVVFSYFGCANVSPWISYHSMMEETVSN